MKLQELIKNVELNMPFEEYLVNPSCSGMPALETDRLELEKFIIENRKLLSKSVVFSGDAGFMINYKGKEGAGLSFGEENNGDSWNIEVLSGAKSRKSLRVARSLNWVHFLTDNLVELSGNPESEVKSLTMPLYHDIANIEQAKSKNVSQNYLNLVINLKMKYSEELKMYIVDVRKNLSEIF